jgi:hypothetical protein
MFARVASAKLLVNTKFAIDGDKGKAQCLLFIKMTFIITEQLEEDVIASIVFFFNLTKLLL